LTPEEHRALDALRRMKRALPEESVLESSRRAFLEGTVPPGSIPEEGGGENPIVSPGPPGGSISATWRPTRSIRAFVSRLALPVAAALILILIGVWGSTPGSRWVVTDVVAPAGVRLAAGEARTGEAVSSGPIAVVDTSAFGIQLGQDVRLRVLAGTEIVLPDPPRRLLPSSITLRVDKGEVYGTTGGPLAYGFRIQTPEAEAVLHGTTFAAFRTDDATCFCLYEGELHVADASGGRFDLEPGFRIFVHRDGRPPRREPLSDMEVMKLSMMRAGGLAP
jgi:hypothetical protein